jgi:uncharacterized protein (TIGR03086 family)
MTTEQLSRALGSVHGVLAKVRPDQLDGPTPCASWTVRQLVNHVIGAPRTMARLVTKGEFRAQEEDYCAGDYLAAHEESAEEVTRAFQGEGALEKTYSMPFGEVPGTFMMEMVATDQLAHAWDLARATGQPTDLEPELAAALLSRAAVPDRFRGADGVAPFGPEQPVPEGASPADRLAAYLGRRV